MNYNVNLEEFQGPMDLLLELIKKNNLDIYNINISLITEEYLKEIKKMEKVNLNISGDYLVLAAELLKIKGLKLLPNQTEETEQEEQEFINRVVEYKLYKEITDKFKDLNLERSHYYSKPPSDISQYKKENDYEERITEEDLIIAFKEFLKRKQDESPLEGRVTTKEYSISRRTDEIITILKETGKINFFQLFEKQNKPFVIVTFLAILDMTRNKIIKIDQGDNGDIFLVRRSAA